MADSTTIERSILAMMLDPKEIANIIAEAEPEDFQDIQFRKMFMSIRTLYEQGKTIDLVVLATELKQNVREVMDIAQFAPFARGNVSAQIAKMRELRERNTLAILCGKMANQFLEGDMEEAKTELMQAMAPKIKTKDLIGPKDAAQYALEVFSQRKDRKSNGGIWTTFVELNNCLNGGFEPGQLIIIAAPTKKGKSAFVANILRDIGVTQRIPSLLINTEMSQEQLSLRNASILSGVDHFKIATGQTSDEEDQRVLDGIEKLNLSKLYTLYAPELNINKMVAYLRQFTIQHKIRVAAIDYIGRMDTQDPKLKEWEVLKLAAKKLKTMAQQLNITVIMLAQVSDDGVLEGAKGMKNECDLFAHLRPMTTSELREMSGYNYCLVIEANRSGPQAKIPLNYYGNILTFTDKINAELAFSVPPEAEEETTPAYGRKKKPYSSFGKRY